MIRSKFRKYYAFTKAGILDGFAYKFSALGWILGDLVSMFILFFLWQAIFANSPTTEINGMNFSQMVTYLIFARIASTLVFSTPSFWIVSGDIYVGGIAINLIKPISYRYRILAGGFGGFISVIIFMFLPLMIVAVSLLYFGVGVSLPSLPAILFFFLSAILSFVIADAFNFLFGELVIFTSAYFGLMIIKNIIMSFFSGGLLPTSFFPEWLQIVLRFLPFQSMIENPVNILMGKTTGIDILYTLGLQLLWVVILEVLCKVTFGRMKKHIVSVGG